MKFTHIKIILFVLLAADLVILFYLGSNEKTEREVDPQLIASFYGETYDEGLVEDTEIQYLEKANGAVINIWLDNTSKLENLQEHDVKYLFVDIGGMEKSGLLPQGEEREQTKDFIDFIEEYEQENEYDFILLPYSEVSSYKYNTDSTNFQNGFIKSYVQLSNEGFDGVLVDIEPIKFEERDSFVDFLSDISANLSEEKIVAVYSGHVTKRESENVWEWDIKFYREVSEHVDLISVPLYDTGLVSQEDYEESIEDKVKMLSREVGTSYLFGIPTHKPSPETSEIALSSYKKTVDRNPSDAFLGITVFAEWTATKEDWENVEEII